MTTHLQQVINEGFQAFDSQEELDFYYWLLEAQEHGLISNIKYQPETFMLSNRVSLFYEKQLKTKVKECEHFLFHPHFYTPDFYFEVVGSRLREFFTISKYTKNTQVWTDVKGVFNRHNDAKQFSMNCKWMWQAYGIYIEKIVPVKLFLKTWVSESCRYTPQKRQPVKKYIGVPNIEGFLEERK